LLIFVGVQIPPAQEKILADRLLVKSVDVCVSIFTEGQKAGVEKHLEFPNRIPVEIPASAAKVREESGGCILDGLTSSSDDFR
jgi:hypothetical protein